MKTFGMLLLVPALQLATGCFGDPAVVAQQKEVIEQQGRMIEELKSTMDDQGDVIVEQIAMMAEMQATIDKQRNTMKEATETLQKCSKRM